MMVHTAVAGGGVPALPAVPACCDVGVGVPALVVGGVSVIADVGAITLVVATTLVGGEVPALVVVGVGVEDSLLLSMLPKHTDLSTSAAKEDNTYTH